METESPKPMVFDQDIVDHIAETLHCDPQLIGSIEPLSMGLTNDSWRFEIPGGIFAYRRPGVGTEELVDRKAEKEALELAKRLGLDATYIAMDVDEGWKISRFIPQDKQIDAHDPDFIAEAMEIARLLHAQDVQLSRRFDFFDEGVRYESILTEKSVPTDAEYDRLHKLAFELHDLMDADSIRICISHNDFFYLNFIFRDDGRLNLLDWEYAGMSDEYSDFGTFVVCCRLSREEARYALTCYLEREPTEQEWRHGLALVGLAGWCWYVWSVVKESEGEDVGEWKEIYRRYALSAMEDAVQLYRKEGHQ